MPTLGQLPSAEAISIDGIQPWQSGSQKVQGDGQIFSGIVPINGATQTYTIVGYDNGNAPVLVTGCCSAYPHAVGGIHRMYARVLNAAGTVEVVGWTPLAQEFYNHQIHRSIMGSALFYSLTAGTYQFQLGCYNSGQYAQIDANDYWSFMVAEI